MPGAMKLTLLAIGVAVLVSLMFVPDTDWPGCTICVVVGDSGFTPFFLVTRIAWGQFTLQTIFLAVLGAVLVNLLPGKPKK
jgi:hypothetical protein